LDALSARMRQVQNGHPIGGLGVPATEGSDAEAIADVPSVMSTMTASTTVPAGRIVWRQGYQFVRIEPAADVAAGGGAPLGLNAAAVRAALLTVHVRRGSAWSPAFEPAEADVLAEPIARALAAAGPGRDVAFAVERPQHAAPGAMPGAMTAGRVFAQDGGLGIILGMVGAAYQGDLIGVGAPPTILTGTRAAVPPGAVAIEMTGAVSPGASGRADWGRIAPSAWAGINLAVVVPAPPKPAVAPVTKPAAMTVSMEPTHDPQEIERRLQALKTLLDKHAISPQDYAKYKAQLLSWM
jgi:hypothetical protein